MSSSAWSFFGYRQLTRWDKIRRRRAKRAQSRIHLLQQLERRDIPGGMLPASLLTLLGEASDGGDDVGSQLAKLSARAEAQRTSATPNIGTQSLGNHPARHHDFSGRRLIPM